MHRLFIAALVITLGSWLAIGCQPDRRELLAPCPPDDPECAAACDEAESLAVYRQRIQPLLDDARPSSCNTCHLTGIPLDAFVRETPCHTMACLMDKDLVDFADVEQSRILQWIEKGQPHPEMQGAAQAEYEGFRAWIAYSARCQDVVCSQIAEPCGPPLDGGPAVVDAGPVDAMPPAADATPDAMLDAMPPPPDATPDAMPPPPDATPDAMPDATTDAEPIVDDGPCGPETRTTLFLERVMPWKGRCNHCHAADGVTAGVGGAPLWLVNEESRPAARATIAAIVERGLVLDGDPTQSMILLKPLHRGHGGVRHGGGNKFLSLEDPAYLDFLAWVDRHARCESGAPLDGGLPDAAASDMAAPDMAAPDMAAPDMAPSLDAGARE